MASVFKSAYQFLEEDGDESLLPWLWKALFAFMAFFSCAAFARCVWVPYGRYGNQRGLLRRLGLTSLKLPARQVWLLQEMPSLVVPLFLVLSVGGRHVGSLNPNIVLLGMFLLHYANRYIHVAIDLLRPFSPDLFQNPLFLYSCVDLLPRSSL